MLFVPFIPTPIKAELIEFPNYEQIRNEQAIKEIKQDDQSGSHVRPVKTVLPKDSKGVINQTLYSGRNYSKDEVQQLIRDYSTQFGIDPATPICIASKESGFNQFSKNKSSSASGVFQYLTSTWGHTDEGKVGMNVFDADANVKAAVKYMAVHKSTQPWSVRSSCPPLKLL